MIASALVPSSSPLKASVSRPLGQVQLELEGTSLFASSDSISFLGQEASRTIGDGARWRHPYPQTWSWPPKEPLDVAVEARGASLEATVDQTSFQQEYDSKPSLLLESQPDGAVCMQATLENLEGEEKQAWIVAPFAMPAGHSASSPKALGVFPASKAELDAIPDGPSEASRWQEDAEHGLLFVNPGGVKAEGQEDKLLLTDRWSAFAREGDSSLLLMPATGEAGPEAFQVFAAFDGYVEMEWAGRPAPAGQESPVSTTFRPVSLSSLGLSGDDGQVLEAFGESGQGLQAELTRAVQALGL